MIDNPLFACMRPADYEDYEDELSSMDLEDQPDTLLDQVEADPKLDQNEK
jgi:hypothetical protein